MNQAFFGRKGRWFLVGLSLLSFGALVFGLIYGSKLVDPDPTGLDSYGVEAIDHEGFVELMQALGFHAERWRLKNFADASAPVWFIESDPQAEVDGEELRLETVLLERKDAGRVSVVVLPKWRGFRDSGELVVEPVSSETLEELVTAIDPALYVTNRADFSDQFSVETLSGSLGSFRVEVPWLQTLEIPSNYDVLLGFGYQAVIAQDPAGQIIISDPDILHNYNFHRADHAAIVQALVRHRLQTDTVVVDEVFHGHGQQLSLASALGEFPVILIVLHGLALMLMLVLVGAFRFGAPKIEQIPYGRGPRDMIAVAASVLAAGQRAPRLATNYVEYVLRDLARRIFSETVHHGMQHAERLDQVAVKRGIAARAAALVREARALEASSGRRVRESITLARKAYDFRRQLLQQKTPWPSQGSQRGES